MNFVAGSDVRSRMIEVVKGFAIILVVMGHVIQCSLQPGGHDFFEQPLFRIIYMFHMPLFVFISGYLMAASLRRRSAVEVFLNKYRSLLVPFIVWGSLGMLTLIGLDLLFVKSSPAGFSWQAWADKLIINSPVWFVWFIWMLFLSACLLLVSVELEKYCGLAAYGIIYMLLFLFPWNQVGGIYYLQFFYFFYLAGYFTHRSGIPIGEGFGNSLIVPLAGIIFFCCAVVWVKTDFIYVNKMVLSNGHLPEEVVRLVYRFISGLTGIILVCQLGAFFVAKKPGLWLAFIGGFSLDIYLIQRYLLEGVYSRLVWKAGIKFEPQSWYFFGILLPGVTIVVIGLSIVISGALIRKNSSLNRLLLGGRFHG